MTTEAAIAGSCLTLAFAAIVGALRCLADRLLPSAAIYTAMAVALFGGAAKAAIDAL
ncbi:MAG: hypothetical protein QOJ29_3941 [Thermoleophilaceae bacterium]|jgi:hypothetical protein|nr:hypothetical protein [Thermoleophilaceae bacterium]